MLPVGRVRLDHPAVIGEDRVECLRILGRGLGKAAAKAAGLNRRKDRPRVDRLEIVGHDIDHRVRRGAELVGVHVPEPGQLLLARHSSGPFARRHEGEFTDGRDVGTPRQRDCRGIPNPQEGAVFGRVCPDEW